MNDESERRPDRREFLKWAGALLFPACGAQGLSQEARYGRILARPGAPGTALPAGRTELDFDGDRDGFIHVPARYDHTRPTPLLVLFHGAGQHARFWESAVPIADELGIILVVPTSRRATWDRVQGRYGRDLQLLNAVLGRVFTGCNVDPQRLAFGGFSDGASYALSLGLVNGDFVTHVLAFSPGFLAPGDRRGKPKIHITHGTRDNILPIDSTSRTLVPRLRADGYDVTYIEFDGGHRVTPEHCRQAFARFTGAASTG